MVGVVIVFVIGFKVKNVLVFIVVLFVKKWCLDSCVLIILLNWDFCLLCFYIGGFLILCLYFEYLG